MKINESSDAFYALSCNQASLSSLCASTLLTTSHWAHLIITPDACKLTQVQGSATITTHAKAGNRRQRPFQWQVVYSI